MDWYYVDKTEITNEETDALLQNPEKKGFVNSMFGPDKALSQQTYYSDGDRMFATHTSKN